MLGAVKQPFPRTILLNHSAEDGAQTTSISSLFTQSLVLKCLRNLVAMLTRHDVVLLGIQNLFSFSDLLCPLSQGCCENIRQCLGFSQNDVVRKRKLVHISLHLHVELAGLRVHLVPNRLH